MPLLLLGLPFRTSLLLVQFRAFPGLRGLHLAAWGLASVSGLLVFLTGPALHPVRLWGLSLYLGLAACTLIWETLSMVNERRPAT